MEDIIRLEFKTIDELREKIRKLRENGFEVGTDVEVWDDTTWRFLGNFEIEDLYKLVKGE